MKSHVVYLARLLSACVFCLILAKANTWLDTLNNTVLVFGYRSFILLAPLFLLFAKRWITFFSFFASIIGMGFWFNHYLLLGTILFSAGMAIGGYVLKYHASKTPNGAANNRIALNIGGILSGIVIASPYSNNYFLWLGFIMLFITLLCSFPGRDETPENDIHLKNNFTFSQLKSLRGISWALIGITTGIKIVSITSILPQYLLHYYDSLPNWYGWVISLNCIVVVLLQKPVMAIMKNLSLNQALTVLITSMLVIALPSAFYCQHFMGAIIWVFLLTLFECAVSYLDVFAREEGTLLIKECSVGIGMAMTVFVMRSFIPIHAALMIGCFGLLAILLALKLFRANVFESARLTKTI